MSGRISIYRNVYDKTSKYTINILDALNRIKTGKSAKAIIELRNEVDIERKDKMKLNLPSVTFSGTFSERLDDKLIEHSGFICLDFDDVDIVEYKEKFKKWKYSYAVWVSPRGGGIKVLVKLKDGSKHRQHFLALKKLFPNTDEKCVNESRVCFESYDEDIYINENSNVFDDIAKVEVYVKTENRNEYDNYKKLIAWLEKSNKMFVSGNRNHYIFILAGAMCRFGFSESDTNEYLLEDFMSDDFSHKEISRTIQSAFKQNKPNAGTVEFNKDKIQSKETSYEVDPHIFEEGFKPKDIIYGSDVLEGALKILESGYESAETTYIPLLDEYFKFKKGELTVFSGVGNYGKSWYLYQLLLIKSFFNGDKWAIFSPEHFPAEEFYVDFTEMLLGCACDGGKDIHGNEKKRIPKEVFMPAYEFVSKHFFYIYPETISPTPEYVKTKFTELIIKENVSGVVIDPFNQLSNDYGKSGGRSDKYLETFLADCKHFGQINNVFFILVSHPHKLTKAADGNYPCPDIFDLADGAMWNNKADNILIYHRPFAQTIPDNSECEHHSKKLKRQKHKIKKGFFKFDFRRNRRRFYFDGKNPLEGNRFEYNSDNPQEPPPTPINDWDKEDAPF